MAPGPNSTPYAFSAAVHASYAAWKALYAGENQIFQLDGVVGAVALTLRSGIAGAYLGAQNPKIAKTKTVDAMLSHQFYAANILSTPGPMDRHLQIVWRGWFISWPWGGL